MDERREYKILSQLVKFQQNLPGFLKRELSLEGVTTTQGLLALEKAAKMKEKKLLSSTLTDEDKLQFARLADSAILSTAFGKDHS